MTAVGVPGEAAVVAMRERAYAGWRRHDWQQQLDLYPESGAPAYASPLSRRAPDHRGGERPRLASEGELTAASASRPALTAGTFAATQFPRRETWQRSQ